MKLVAAVAFGVAAGVGLVRWYDRSARAKRFVFYLFTADVRRSDPHLYGRVRNPRRGWFT